MVFIAEVKAKKSVVSTHLKCFKEKLQTNRAFQLVFEDGIDEGHKGIRQMSAVNFLPALV
jgi:hypothetical protein